MIEFERELVHPFPAVSRLMALNVGQRALKFAPGNAFVFRLASMRTLIQRVIRDLNLQPPATA